LPGTWLDDQGRPFRWATLRGNFTVVNMAYGACRRVCSTSLRRMEELQSRADARHLAISFVVVGIDPELDRPADWASYRVDHKLGRKNWQFLTGDQDATRQLAARLGVRYWHYGDHVMHDFRIALLAPDGRVVAALNAADDDLGKLIP
jgi:cytochrome oxidase Cu insertion factor (SCO1/SenC/PrrC family)